MTNDERLQRVIARLPYPDQVKAIDTMGEPNAVRFFYGWVSILPNNAHPSTPNSAPIGWEDAR